MEPTKLVEYNGTIIYMLNGSFHRLDGPACEYADGYKEWYIDDIQYKTELEYWIAVQQYLDTHQTT